jgi:ubiquitin-protein ligase E3 C
VIWELKQNRYGYGPRNRRLRISVRRGNVSVDGFDKLSEADLRTPIEIVFVDQFGQEE